VLSTSGWEWYSRVTLRDQDRRRDREQDRPRSTLASDEWTELAWSADDVRNMGVMNGEERTSSRCLAVYNRLVSVCTSSRRRWCEDVIPRGCGNYSIIGTHFVFNDALQGDVL
jgi:hypothetical protein